MDDTTLKAAEIIEKAAKEPHDPHADGRHLTERVEQWKRNNPEPPKSADDAATEKRKKAGFTKKKGPTLRKGVKVFRGNDVGYDEGIVIKKAKEYLYIDWSGTEEKIEIALFTYQMNVKYNPVIVTWQWNVAPIKTERVFETRIEGDWEKTYDHTGKSVAMKLTPEAHKRTFWMLRDPDEFLTEQGYTLTKDEASSLQDFGDGIWPDTYGWFWGTCHERKELGAEVIKWMVGPLKEVVGDRLELKRFLLGFPPSDFGKLVAAVYDKKITATMGKEVLTRMYLREEVDEILKDDKYKISSGDDMIEFVRKVIEANPEQIAELKEGKDKILGWLVGQVMKESKGKANAGEVNKMFREELGL